MPSWFSSMAKWHMQKPSLLHSALCMMLPVLQELDLDWQLTMQRSKLGSKLGKPPSEVCSWCSACTNPGKQSRTSLPLRQPRLVPGLHTSRGTYWRACTLPSAERIARVA